MERNNGSLPPIAAIGSIGIFCVTAVGCLGENPQAIEFRFESTAIWCQSDNKTPNLVRWRYRKVASHRDSDSFHPVTFGLNEVAQLKLTRHGHFRFQVPKLPGHDG